MDFPADQDAWPLLAQHIDEAIDEARRMLSDDVRGLLDLAEARYREGERLYHRDWMNRPLRWFDSEAAEEAADFVIYLAMKRVKARWIGRD